MTVKILHGDCRDVLRTLPAESVHCVVTSPPYWGLRDYGTAKWEGGDPGCDHLMPPNGVRDKGRDRAASGGTFHDSPIANRIQQQYAHECAKCGARRIDSQIGLEATLAEHVETMVTVFREVRRVLRKDGTLWLNYGDCYATSPAGNRDCKTNSRFVPRNKNGELYGYGLSFGGNKQFNTVGNGLKPKDLCGIPWRVAFALQADGWYLRQDIVWSKPNPMPESVQDRCCKSHEYVFLLSKSERYFFDSEAIKEDAAEAMQYMPSGVGDNGILQEQPEARRPNGKVPRLHGNRAQEMGSQVQRLAQGAGDGSTLLLFGEGAGDEKGVSGKLRTDGGNAGAIPDRATESRKGGQVQGSPEALRPEPEGEAEQGEKGQGLSKDGKGESSQGESQQTLLCDGEGELQQEKDQDQEGLPNKNSRLHLDERRVDTDQGQFPQSLRILQPAEGTAGNGSCNPVVEGRPSHGGEHRPGMSDMQRQERQSAKRTKRSVWTIATHPYPQAHFATFPPALVEPCIKAGCPEKCCGKCGAGWVRETEVEQIKLSGNKGSNPTVVPGAQNWAGVTARTRKEVTTLGFSPSCSCGAETKSGTVLDPFGGAGTSGLVADRLGRNAVLIELNPDYAAMARKRIEGDAGLFAQVAAE